MNRTNLLTKRTCGMDPWNRLTDFRGEEGEGGRKKLAKENTCVYAQHMATDNSEVKAGAWGAGCRGRGQVLEVSRGLRGDICNSVNSKNKNNANFHLVI